MNSYMQTNLPSKKEHSLHLLIANKIRTLILLEVNIIIVDLTQTLKLAIWNGKCIFLSNIVFFLKENRYAAYMSFPGSKTEYLDLSSLLPYLTNAVQTHPKDEAKFVQTFLEDSAAKADQPFSSLFPKVPEELGISQFRDSSDPVHVPSQNVTQNIGTSTEKAMSAIGTERTKVESNSDYGKERTSTTDTASKSVKPSSPDSEYKQSGPKSWIPVKSMSDATTTTSTTSTTETTTSIAKKPEVIKGEPSKEGPKVLTNFSNTKLF
jgi:hypothetical protein